VASASPLCSTQTDWSFATWSSPGFSCEADDLIFSNFSVTSVPSNMALNFSTDAGGDTINLNLVNGTFAQTFSFSYNVTLDDTAFPANNQPEWVINNASAALQAVTGAYGTLEKDIYQNSGGALIGTDVYTQTGNIGGDIRAVPIGLTSIFVVDSFSYGSGTFLDASNTFTDVQLPEPSTLALLGVALIGLSVIVRKRSKSNSLAAQPAPLPPSQR
jgi:hypothetical protein